MQEGVRVDGLSDLLNLARGLHAARMQLCRDSHDEGFLLMDLQTQLYSVIRSAHGVPHPRDDIARTLWCSAASGNPSLDLTFCGLHISDDTMQSIRRIWSQCALSFAELRHGEIKSASIQDAEGRIEPRLIQALSQINRNALVSRLTDDVLLVIFSMGQRHDWEFDVGEGGVAYKASEAPFVMLASFVCRRWRALALNSSALWQTLTHAFGGPCLYIRPYFERSKGSPISIRLIDMTDPNPAVDPTGENYSSYFDTVYQIGCYIPRLEWLSVHATRRTCLYHILRGFEDAAVPLLRTFILDVNSRSPDEWTTMEPAEIFSGGAEVLETIAMDVPLHSCWYSDRMENLRSLSLTALNISQAVTADELLEFLSGCPGLQSLRIVGSVVSGPVDLTHEPVALHCLKRFHLSLDLPGQESFDDLVKLYLECLHMPCLRTLAVKAAKTMNSLPISSVLEHLLLPSGASRIPELTMLEVDDALFTSVRRCFLYAHPMIEELRLYNSSADAFLVHLMDETGDVLWPRLASLRISECDTVLLCRFVSFRIQHGVPLEEVTLREHSESSIHPDQHTWLRDQLKRLEFSA